MAEESSKIILPGFRSNVPDIPLEHYKPAWNLPLYTLNERGFELDFGPLLLFDALIMDKHCVDFIEDSSLSYLQPLRTSILRLRAEGMVEVRDFEAVLKPVMHKIVGAAERELQSKESVLNWARAIQHTFVGYQKRLPRYQEAMGCHYDNTIMTTEFGTHVYQMHHDGAINDERTRDLQKHLFSPKRPQSKRFALMQELIRPTAQYTYINIVLEDLLGAPFMDAEWTSSIYPAIYDHQLRKLEPEARLTMKEIELTQKIFSTWIPMLRPSNVDQVIRLVRKKKKSIVDFRGYVRECVLQGVDIDRDLGKELLVTALDLNMKVGKRRKILSRISTLGGTASSFFTGGIVESLVGSIITEGADRILDPRGKANLRWLYSLIEVRDS